MGGGPREVGGAPVHLHTFHIPKTTTVQIAQKTVLKNAYAAIKLHFFVKKRSKFSKINEV